MGIIWGVDCPDCYYGETGWCSEHPRPARQDDIEAFQELRSRFSYICRVKLSNTPQAAQIAAYNVLVSEAITVAIRKARAEG